MHLQWNATLPPAVAKVARLAAVALVLAACSKSSSASAPGDRRVVADEHGFRPSSLSLPKGGPGSKESVTFVRTSDKTCATEVVFPELGAKKDLPLNEAVSVEIPTESERTLTFQCGMGMYKGSLLVK